MRRNAFSRRQEKIWNTNSYQLVVIITIIIILEALYYHLYCLYATSFCCVSFSMWSQQTYLYSRVKCLSVSSHLHSQMSSVNNFPSTVIVFLVLICCVVSCRWRWQWRQPLLMINRARRPHRQPKCKEVHKVP